MTCLIVILCVIISLQMLVPVVSLQSVLDLIPVHTEVAYLNSDMQGADFGAIKSVGNGLRRVKWLATEVWHHNVQSLIRV